MRDNYTLMAEGKILSNTPKWVSWSSSGIVVSLLTVKAVTDYTSILPFGDVASAIFLYTALSFIFLPLAIGSVKEIIDEGIEAQSKGMQTGEVSSGMVLAFPLMFIAYTVSIVAQIGLVPWFVPVSFFVGSLAIITASLLIYLAYWLAPEEDEDTGQKIERL